MDKLLHSNNDNEHECCALCGTSRLLTFHHLIPKTCHRNKWFKKHFSLDDMRNRGVMLCRRCHSFIHKQLSEKELGRHFNTLETLSAHPDISRFARWAKKKQK